MNNFLKVGGYRGRLAPTPTGMLHLGHAHTFLTAARRAQGGCLVLRIEDLDRQRCRQEFIRAALEDLKWLGIQWQEGPDCGGAHGPYIQSQRSEYYLSAWHQLRASGCIYPSPHSRVDVERALSAPHAQENAEPIFPVELRPEASPVAYPLQPEGVNWRFRVPDGQVIEFFDKFKGRCSFTAGVDFGDFLVWRKDGFPSYELAVVVDDAAMEITEVVRGEDLLLSTARQILLYQALGWRAPDWCHCPLICDEQGQRLAKRNAALSIAHLRNAGCCPEDISKKWSALMEISGTRGRD